MKNPENPSAFPEPFLNDPNYSLGISKGMTLRDYFAAKAMQAQIGNQNYMYEYSKRHKDLEVLAMEAYMFADALLKERSKP
jgi:hypothetical protein